MFLHRQVAGVQDLRTLRHVRLAAAEIPRVTQVPLLQVHMDTTSNTTTVIYSNMSHYIWHQKAIEMVYFPYHVKWMSLVE